MSDKDLVLRFLVAGELAMEAGYSTSQIVAAYEIAKTLTISSSVKVVERNIVPASVPIPPPKGEGN